MTDSEDDMSDFLSEMTKRNALSYIKTCQEELPDYLYHYCSTESFYSIVTNATLRLSSLTMSNDSMEGKWALEVANEVCMNEIHPDYRQFVIDEMSKIPDSVGCVGLCLSEKRDLLSQWRGYSSNGSGVCIGISRESLIEMKGIDNSVDPQLEIQKIIYDINAQKDILRPLICDSKKYIEDEFLDIRRRIEYIDRLNNISVMEKTNVYIKNILSEARLKVAMMGLFPFLFKLKTEAFHEEAEWRVLKFIFDNNYEGCKFKPTERKVVPFVDVNLSSASKPFISELILGPKHETPIHIMQGFLKENGFPDVKIEKSAATYR